MTAPTSGAVAERQQALDHLAAILPNAVEPEERIELRAITPDGIVTRTYVNSIEAALDFIARHRNAENVYVGVATRRCPRTGKSPLECGCKKKGGDHSTRVQVVWGDLDVGEGKSYRTILEAMAAIGSCALPPSVIILTGHGVHPYWRLAEPTADFDRVEGINRAIKSALDGDGVCDRARVMRLAGTLNHKEQPALDVVLTKAVADAYSLDALEAAFGRIDGPPPVQTPAPPPRQADLSALPEPDDTFIERADSLLSARNGFYQRILDGDTGAYPSTSQAQWAFIMAAVKRWLSDEDIWRLIEGSGLYDVRVKRKDLVSPDGEARARWIIQHDIDKARRQVQLFERDPAEMYLDVVGEVTVGEVTVGEVTDADRPGTDETDGAGDEGGPHLSFPPPAPADQSPEDEPLPTDDDFISEYVRYAAARTDAPLSHHRGVAIELLSTLAGPRPRLRIATAVTGWKLTAWFIYLANSTEARKTTVHNLGRHVLTEVVGEQAIISWEGSPQGILQALGEVDGTGAIFIRDEMSGLLTQMSRPNTYLAGLTQLLIRAYDGGRLEMLRTKKKKTRWGDKEDDSDRVEDPFLALLAAAPRDSFIKAVTLESWTSGFMARAIIDSGASTPRPMRALTPEMELQAAQVVAHARRFHQKAQRIGDIHIDQAVLDHQFQVEREWLGALAGNPRRHAAAPAIQRLIESCLKIGALLAIDAAADDAREVWLDDQHFAIALAMAERWRRAALDIIDRVGSSTFRENVESVRRMVYSEPGVTVRDLMRAHRDLRARDFDEVLGWLAGAEEVEVQAVKTGGRPSKRAWPFGHGRNGATP